MSEAKHTPGPWAAHLGSGNGETWLVHEKTNTIDGGYFCQVTALHFTEEARVTAEANARLCAAAPDLLAACKAALADLAAYREHGIIGELHSTEQLRAAISKAEKAS